MGTEFNMEVEEEIELEEPEMCSVYLLNDNYSTFDFVMKVLTQVFRKTVNDAEKITMNIHHQGECCVGTYTKDIALTKIRQVDIMAEKEQYPLKAVLK